MRVPVLNTEEVSSSEIILSADPEFSVLKLTYH